MVPNLSRSHALDGGYDLYVPSRDDSLNGMVPTLKRAAAALRDAGIPFLVAGGVASWVRGGPSTDHDLDFLVKPEDAERALATRALREQIDWDDVRERTTESPFGRAFFVIATGLGIVD